MYDIQLSERSIVIEKSKYLSLIGVFVQQNYSQTNAPRVRLRAVIHSFIHICLIIKKRIQHKTSMIKLKIVAKLRRYSKAGNEC